MVQQIQFRPSTYFILRTDDFACSIYYVEKPVPLTTSKDGLITIIIFI
jgi:hypothetical protein